MQKFEIYLRRSYIVTFQMLSVRLDSYAIRYIVFQLVILVVAIIK